MKDINHKYSHLGKAPYRLVGYFYNPAVQDINGQWSGGNSTCDHCGQYISHVFVCQGVDGKKFNLGSTHVEYLGDEGIRKEVKAKVKEVRREADKKKREAKWAEQRAKYAEQDKIRREQELARETEIENAYKAKLEAIKSVLASKPHPNHYFQRQGKTLLDYVMYFVSGAYGKVSNDVSMRVIDQYWSEAQQ